MDERATFSFRASRALMAQVDAYALQSEWLLAQTGRGKDHGGRDVGRSALVVALLEALVEDRVTIAPRPIPAGSNPFPCEEVEPGSSPDFPAFIAFHNPTTEYPT
jgi:hypothetical protein